MCAYAASLASRVGFVEHLLRERLVAHDRTEVLDENLGDRLLSR